ncbi:MAG: RHS repeat protein [bacterium]|nr:RHS repeat protein [bacterium]
MLFKKVFFLFHFLVIIIALAVSLLGCESGDDNGPFRLSKHTIFNLDGSKKVEHSISYNSRGYMVSYSSHHIDYITETYTYKYNDAGSISGINLIHENAGEFHVLSAEYNEHGSLSSETFFDTNGSKTISASYESVNNGSLINQDTDMDYAYPGQHKYSSFELDEAGRVVKKATPDLRYYYTYEYDAGGRLITTTHYNDDDSAAWSRSYEYDSSGFLVKKFSNGSLSGEYKNEYDNLGRRIKRSEFNSDGSPYRYETFEYENGSALTPNNPVGLVTQFLFLWGPEVKVEW